MTGNETPDRHSYQDDVTAINEHQTKPTFLSQAVQTITTIWNNSFQYQTIQDVSHDDCH
jgi:hypothetical protein